MTPEDCAYIAGFFDGEGSVTIGRHQSKTDATAYSIHVVLTNRHLPVLQWVQGLFGGSTREHMRNTEQRKRWAPCFVWQLQNKAGAQKFLEAIRPHVRIKQAQVDLAIAYCKLPSPRVRYVALPRTWPLQITDPLDLKVREDMKHQMNVLNMRGPVETKVG